MNDQPSAEPSRILIIDDNAAIHSDFRKILGSQASGRSQLDAVEKALFGNATVQSERSGFRIDSAYQGQEALGMVQRALEEKDPYAMAFVDVRMPPGWDGIETLERLWKCAPELQAVICTAYSDYSWDDITQRLGQTDSLLILKKPFDTVEVLQLAHALTKKWVLARQARLRLEDLDRMVRERTRELQAQQEERLRLEAQLRQSQKMEAIGCLSAGVAHEFNNLLTVIQGHADLLRGTLGVRNAETEEKLSTFRTPNSELRTATESVERIAQASQRAASLTRQLLAFSRKQPMQLKAVQLSTTVQRLEKMLGQLIGECFELCLECAVALPAIRADEGNMEQILINLVLNARDAMPQGGAIQIRTSALRLDEVAARGHPEARPGQFVCLTVSDSGCGMAPELLSRIFDPFFTTKEVGRGTGLGLSTVHGIVRQHQGWIQVSSQVGQGSSFQVFLPAWQGAPEAGQPPLSTLNSQLSTPLPCGAGETILLVEDESSVRRLARLALERGGYHVLEAADGPHALQVWEQSAGTIDLLVTDMVMPNGLSGGALARALQGKDPRLRTLYTSGYSSEVVEEDHSLLQGANFLPKPYDSLSLLKAVKSCLQGPLTPARSPSDGEREIIGQHAHGSHVVPRYEVSGAVEERIHGLGSLSAPAQ